MHTVFTLCAAAFVHRLCEIGHFRKNWLQRYFVLCEDGTLRYWLTKDSYLAV